MASLSTGYQTAGMINFDMGFYKDFHIKEHPTIEFRAELFNIFNRPNFNTIAGNAEVPSIGPGLGSGTFPQVIGVGKPCIAEFV